MKKCFKNKRGFTLLEVMLAVSILLIATSMILSGFLVTFNYSNNTTVFAKLGNKNYATSVDSLAQMSATTVVNSKFSAAGSTVATVTVTGPSGYDNMFSDYTLIVWKTASSAGGTGSLTYDTSVDPSSASTSRSSFAYSPKVCQSCKNAQGQLRRYKAADGSIKWFCYNESSATGRGCGWES